MQVVAVALGAIVLGSVMRSVDAWSLVVGAIVIVLPQAGSSWVVLKVPLGGFGLLLTEALRVALCCLGLALAALLLPWLNWAAVVVGLAVSLKGPWLVLLFEQMSEKA